MVHGMTRREFAAAAGAASLAAVGFGAQAKAADAKTLRFIAQADLRVLDPIWTTAYITRNHGYMVFDTLFAIDDKFKPHPQMVGDFNISPDKLLYSFTLRDGLRFHDGQPVRGADCVASLRRWMVRDGLGQALAVAVDEMKGGDDKSFTIRLKEPFPLLIEGLAKLSSLVPFIMPERLAKTDPYQQVTEMVGSGPFKFVAEAFQPGHQVAYVKNPDYVAPKRTGELGMGRKGGQSRPRRVALYPRCHDKDRGTQQRRSRLVGEPPARCLARAGLQSRYYRDRVQPAALDGIPALQSAAAALRQCKDASGRIGGRQSSRFHERLRGRPAELEGVCLVLHLRNSDVE